MKKDLRSKLLFLMRIFLLGTALPIVFSGVIFAQGINVTGRVTSAEDIDGLPGVNVVEKGTTNGVVTDIDGAFNINVSDGATLIFSSVGFVTEEVIVGNQSVINLQLVPDITQLEELVVIGYGTVKKSDLIGSVASVGGDDIVKVPVSTVAEALTGRMAGVQVTTTEGSPDAEIRIRVRGGASLTQDSSPLYIVDGFPVNSISDLSSSDIQSIDILKDASSTAIYGSRGANGVVIITTKGGKAGKVTVDFNSFYGAKKIAKTMDVLTPGDYARWQYEYAVLRNSSDISSYEDYFGLFQDIDLYEDLPANDWQRQIYGRTGQVLSNDLSIRGGSEKFNYSANFARFDERAIMIGSDYLRNNINLKLNNKPNDKVELMFSMRYSDTKINGSGANEQNEASSADPRLKHAVVYSPIPIAGVSVPDDTDEQISTDLIPPIIATEDTDREQVRKNFNIGASFAWNILENLRFKTEFGVDNFYYSDNRFYGRSTYYVRNAPALENQNLPAARLIDRKEYRLRSTNTITYDIFQEQDHNLQLLVGQEALYSEINQLTNVIHGYPKLFTAEEAFKLTTQGDPFSTDNNFSPDDKLLSFFARANYDFKNRYLLTAVFRADGSSRFLGDNVWGYFPSVSAGWKISEESFMQGAEGWLDQLKLRASYGLAGNNNIPRGQTVQSFNSSTTAWINEVPSYWAASKDLANPDLKWETTTTRNIGLDFGLLKGRLNGTVEVYQNNTEDLLIRFPVPGTGYDYQYRNMGETENRGLEISLNLIAVDREKYGLSVDFNIGLNENKIKSLGVMEELSGSEVTTGWASTQIPNDFLARVGDPIGMLYGYVNDGRYEVSDFEGYDANSNQWILKGGVAGSDFITVRPGAIKLRDLDGDNIVTIADRRFIGNTNPRSTGGLVINGYAYGFDLMAAFNWSFGNKVYNANKIEFTTSNQNNQYRSLITMQEEGQRWTNIDWLTGELVNDPATLEAINANTTMWSPFMDRYVFSDWAVEDGSFLRLNTLTLGYTLPNTITEKLKIQNLRFYATGYNLFILTNYSGFDPEVSTRRKTPLTPGVDYSAYPRSRQISIGLNLTF